MRINPNGISPRPIIRRAVPCKLAHAFERPRIAVLIQARILSEINLIQPDEDLLPELVRFRLDYFHVPSLVHGDTILAVIKRIRLLLACCCL